MFTVFISYLPAKEQQGFSGLLLEQPALKFYSQATEGSVYKISTLLKAHGSPASLLSVQMA